MTTILVQIADEKWTMQAMHLACAMARSTTSTIALLDLIPIQTPFLLGAELNTLRPKHEEQDAIEEYALIAEDYGVEVVLQPMQYESLSAALVQAAEMLNASNIFAYLPHSAVPLWNRFQLWNLQRQLSNHKCKLITLEGYVYTEEYLPGMHMNPIKH
jgi:hypothetical protein